MLVPLDIVYGSIFVTVYGSVFVTSEGSGEGRKRILFVLCFVLHGFV